MQKYFTTQPKLFVSASDLNHPIIRSLDYTKALLKWSEIEKLLSSTYAPAPDPREISPKH
ncbi:MAG: hypothetical protein QS721_02135 [Candidatus Endonucleobacter sp. (ex Gigantidas childressi)]|nr:hypothetical protein [Candidatus Endonucleobacter sp. (ex Gigantidas childressi)]